MTIGVDPLTMGLIAGGTALIGAGSNAVTTHMQNEANKALWREQTAYNTPENQMLRLKKAGLNPALAYGHGVGSNIAGSPPAMQKMPPVDVMSDVAATQQVVNQDVTRQTMEANLDIARQNVREAEARADEAQRSVAYNDKAQDTIGVRPGHEYSSPIWGQASNALMTAGNVAEKTANTQATLGKINDINAGLRKPTQAELEESSRFVDRFKLSK